MKKLFIYILIFKKIRQKITIFWKTPKNEFELLLSLSILRSISEKGAFYEITPSNQPIVTKLSELIYMSIKSSETEFQVNALTIAVLGGGWKFQTFFAILAMKEASNRFSTFIESCSASKILEVRWSQILDISKNVDARSFSPKIAYFVQK